MSDTLHPLETSHPMMSASQLLRIVDSDDMWFSNLMNSLQHTEKGGAQQFKDRRVGAAKALREWAKDTQQAADAPSPSGKTCGTVLGERLAWKALSSASEIVNPPAELQQLLEEWAQSPPYDVFWAEAQEGYHGCLLWYRPKAKAQELVDKFKDKLSDFPSTIPTNIAAGDTQSSASIMSQTMAPFDFLSLFMSVPLLTEE